MKAKSAGRSVIDVWPTEFLPVKLKAFLTLLVLLYRPGDLETPFASRQGSIFYRICRQLMYRHAEVLDRHGGQDGERARNAEAVNRAIRLKMDRYDIDNRRANPLGIDQEIMRTGQCRYSRIDLRLEFSRRARLPIVSRIIARITAYWFLTR